MHVNVGMQHLNEPVNWVGVREPSLWKSCSGGMSLHIVSFANTYQTSVFLNVVSLKIYFRSILGIM